MLAQMWFAGLNEVTIRLLISLKVNKCTLISCHTMLFYFNGSHLINIQCSSGDSGKTESYSTIGMWFKRNQRSEFSFYKGIRAL